MADKENQIPETNQKLTGKPRRRLRPKGYYYGPVGFSMPLCPLGTPTRLKDSLPENPEKLRKSKSAEDLYVFNAKTKKQPRSVRKPACTLMWGDDEDAELQGGGEQGIKRDLQKPPDFAEADDGPEQQMLEEAPDEGFESDKENQGVLDKVWHVDDEDDALDCDCGHGPTRAALKASGVIVSTEKEPAVEDEKLSCMTI